MLPSDWQDNLPPIMKSSIATSLLYLIMQVQKIHRLTSSDLCVANNAFPQGNIIMLSAGTVIMTISMMLLSYLVTSLKIISQSRLNKLKKKC